MHTMARLVAPWLLVALFASRAPAQDPYADFRIPENRTFVWTMSGSGSLFGSFDSDGFSESRRRSFSSGLDTRMSWHAETEARHWDVLVGPSVQWHRQHFREDLSSTFETRDDVAENRSDAQSLLLFARSDQYLRGSDGFLGGEVIVQPHFSQDRRTRDEHVSFPPLDENFRHEESATRGYRLDVTLDLRAGWGRVRDATGVYAVQVLEERLRASGRLSRELAPETRRRLAELYYAGDGFGSAHERPLKYYWREVERILREDGALEDGTLDAWSLERVREPLNQGTVSRVRGFRVAAVTSLVMNRGHIDSDARIETLILSGGTVVRNASSLFGGRKRLFHNDELSGLEVDYDAPLGPRWQVDFATSARYGGGSARVSSLVSSGAVTWLLGERWYSHWDIAHAVESRRVEGTRQPPDWSVQARTSLGYWIEDAWSISADASARQLESRLFPIGFGGLAPLHERTFELAVRLTYRPAGRFTAPGLGISERLTPGGR